MSLGRLMYFGKRREMLPYFAFIEYPCPAYKNPADYYCEYELSTLTVMTVLNLTVLTVLNVLTVLTVLTVLNVLTVLTVLTVLSLQWTWSRWTICPRRRCWSPAREWSS